MAKLPTADDVPFVAPEASRPIGSVNLTGIGEGVAALGKGAQTLGTDIELANARSDALDVATRKTDYLVGKMQLDDQYKSDGGADLEQRYSNDLNALRQRVGAGLQPRALQTLNNHIAVDATRSVLAMRTMGQANAMAAFVTKTDEQGQAVINQIVALPDNDPRRMELMDAHARTLQQMQENGILKPSERLARANLFMHNLGTAEAQAAINSGDPERIQRTIERLNTARTQAAQPSTKAGAINSAAADLGIAPRDLAAAISYETGGSFDPSKWGGKNGNYLGLIQFGPEERAKYGVKPGMSIEDQMPAVVNFLRDRGIKPGMGLPEIYSVINAGSLDQNGSPRWNASDGNGTVRSHVAAIQQQHYGSADKFLGASGEPSPYKVADADGTSPPPQDGNVFSFLPAQQREQLLTHLQTARNQGVAKDSSATFDQYTRQFLDASVGKGDIPDRTQIETDPRLLEPARNHLLAAHGKATADQLAEQEALAKFATPNATWNPYEKDDQGRADVVYNKLGANGPALEAVVDKTGILPKQVATQLRGALVSQNVGEVSVAMQTATNLMTRKANVFAQDRGGKDIEEAAVTFQHYVNDFGMSAETAARRIIEQQSPEYQTKLKARVKNEDLNELIKKNLGVGDLSSGFNQSIFPIGFRPDVGQNPEMRAAMFGDYAEKFRDHYMNNGDIALAKTLAMNDLKKTWGVSNVSGTGILMRYPPDRAPAYAGIENVSDRIAAEAVSSIKQESGMDVSKKDIKFYPLSGGRTQNAYWRGVPPPYQVTWSDKDGLIHTLNPGRAFVADPRAWRETQTQERGAQFEQRRASDAAVQDMITTGLGQTP